MKEASCASSCQSPSIATNYCNVLHRRQRLFDAILAQFFFFALRATTSLVVGVAVNGVAASET